MKQLIFVVVVVGLALGACANEAFIDDVERGSNGEILEGGRLGTTQLRAGDCFSERSGSVVRSVDAVPCREPHRGQILGRASATPNATWPGVGPLTAEAASLCMGLAEELLGARVSDNLGLPLVDLTAYIPDEPAWEDGDRSIVCWVEAAERVTLDLWTATPA